MVVAYTDTSDTLYTNRRTLVGRGKSDMRIFSTFTGIGGFELGIENAVAALAGHPRNEESPERQGLQTAGNSVHGGHSGNPRFVGYSEIDKYAIPVYERHYKGVRNYGDITKINTDELPDFDCLVGGFPCQAFSIAGRRAGFADTRGTLFFELARILRAKQPRLFVFENVKGLLSHDGGRTFSTIISAIDELGYDAQWQVVNSKNHGVPQNRERIIIVGHLRGTTRPEVFPFSGGDQAAIEPYPEVRDVAQTVTASYYKGWKGSHVLIDAAYPGRTPRVYEETAPTVKDYGSGGNKMPMVAVREATRKGYAEATVGDSINLSQPTSRTRRGRVGRGIANTLTAQSMHQATLTTDGLVRRLTPVECERLQGFPDGWTAYGMKPCETIGCERCALLDQSDQHMVAVANSDTQRYKMAGNAVTSNVIQAVFERILV